MGATKKQPLRQCVGCRQMKDKKSLIRILKNEDGICVDVTGKKNGRGAYICQDINCLMKAKSSKGLERSFKMAIEPAVYDELIRSFEEIEAG